MQSYREEYYWWEVVAIGRRFLICACAALLSPRVDALTLSIFVILSSSLFVHIRSSPFLFPLNNSLETANLTTVMFNYLAGILFSSNLLDNFDGMDVFVVCVNSIAIFLMIVAAGWVWKFAPTLSQKLGVTQDLLVPTVISKIARTLSLSHRASAKFEMQPTATSPSTLPQRVEHSLQLPHLPTLPSLSQQHVVFHAV
jgi:hypothetical protein